ncbi:MAG: polysaccharide deacetylase family protein [Clostridia bacterium]|nr:polysaccharide deacetylase family protein [Clostridia bacterium]
MDHSAISYKFFLLRCIALLATVALCAFIGVKADKGERADSTGESYAPVFADSDKSAESDLAAGSYPWIGFGKADNVFCGADTSERVVALTFDDGPHPRYTDAILDILKEYGVKATFFAVGENAELYKEQLKRIADEGHEIGNHTYSHASLKKISPERMKIELTRTAEAVKKITGRMPTVFRPPEGCCNKTVVDCANQLGYTTVLWTVDPRDWSCPPSERVSENILGTVKGGAVILCHDYISAGKSPTPEALRKVIPQLLKEGYSFVTVSELLRAE